MFCFINLQLAIVDTQMGVAWKQLQLRATRKIYTHIYRVKYLMVRAAMTGNLDKYGHRQNQIIEIVHQ